MDRMPWLEPHEQEAVVDRLYQWGLIKTDNTRSLPLKSGGMTDVYINLREARNIPEAIDYIASLYAIALRRLRPDRFMEVPHSVSCFAGPLSIKTGIPYMTIREEEKTGRVGNAKVIGKAPKGSTVAILDDVITDGASKVSAYKFLVENKLTPTDMIILVDRQQGWDDTFLQKGVNIDVWPAMTLHEVRKHLINLGHLERCDPKVEKTNPIIIALDGKDGGDILPFIDTLRPEGCILKVNDLLFKEGMEIIPELEVYGRVMADFKFHDIPNTVANACKRLREYAPWAVTVHASGGEEMMKVAVDALAGSNTLVLAVTVLTSIDERICEDVYHRNPTEQVHVLAELAVRAGVNGFVCSPQEVELLKKLYPNKIFVVPGVRSPGKNANDQKRIGTPAQATGDGADYLVMGRQILNAEHPECEVRRVLHNELNI